MNVRMWLWQVVYWIRGQLLARYCSRCGAAKVDEFPDGHVIISEHCPNCGDRNFSSPWIKLKQLVTYYVR